MRQWLEVYTGQGEDVIQWAALDVTDDNMEEVLAELKEAYGDAEYVHHICGHDENMPCRMAKV